MNEGLKNSLNRIREISSEIYHQYIPIITDDTNISSFGTPILEVPEVRNEFMSALVNRIVYTQFEIKYFNNPLQILEGDRIPLGYAGQDIYVNPAKGRQFNVNDFAGLLQKYEADVKVQYNTINLDLQYPVTVSRHMLKQAFTSWENLDRFIDQLSNSLYNGAYIDEYQFTKYLVAGAYRGNNVNIVMVDNPTTEEQAKAFVNQARLAYLNFQSPSTNYNSWKLIGGEGRPITTWTDPKDIVMIVRNDIRSFLDVNFLAMVFNIDKADLLGRILTVDNFNVYNDDGSLNFDGSAILGIIADKAWFKIKRQDMFLDEFYNANNRTWQYYLNLTKMYEFSYFANATVFATEIPQITITGLDYNNTNSININVGEKEGLDINVTPANANTPKIEYDIASTAIATIASNADNDKHVVITGIANGTTTLTATAGNVQTTLEINVTGGAARSTKKTSSKTQDDSITDKTQDGNITDKT